MSRIPFFPQNDAFGRNRFYELRLFLLVRKICNTRKSEKKITVKFPQYVENKKNFILLERFL